EDAALLAGVERVVHRLLDRGEQRLGRTVETEQVAVLGEELGDRDLALLGGHLLRRRSARRLARGCRRGRRKLQWRFRLLAHRPRSGSNFQLVLLRFDRPRLRLAAALAPDQKQLGRFGSRLLVLRYCLSFYPQLDCHSLVPSSAKRPARL